MEKNENEELQEQNPAETQQKDMQEIVYLLKIMCQGR